MFESIQYCVVAPNRCSVMFSCEILNPKIGIGFWASFGIDNLWPKLSKLATLIVFTTNVATSQGVVYFLLDYDWRYVDI